MASVILDVVVVLVVLGYASRGWHRGLLAGGLGLLGLLGGFAVGLWAGPRLLELLPLEQTTTLARTVALLAMLFVCTVLGQALLGGLGARLRRHGVRPLHTVDSLLGAVGAAGASALVVGLIATAVHPIAPATWARTIDGSATLRLIGDATPDALAGQATRLTGLLDAAGFPSVFRVLDAEPALPAAEPDDATAHTDGVRAASASVVRVTASTPRCRPLSASTGSGWVSSPERVVTNAHVVAGAQDLFVQVGGTGERRSATVVAFDPDLDLAVLLVPGLDAAALPVAGELASADDVAVAGFPLGGAYAVTSGHVRGIVQAPGQDIYGEAGVTREVYSLRATVQQGNSGGPLLTPDGAVAGTIFGRSPADTRTAYALTAAQSAAFIDAAAEDTSPASTQGCRP